MGDSYSVVPEGGARLSFFAHVDHLITVDGDDDLPAEDLLLAGRIRSRLDAMEKQG